MIHDRISNEVYSKQTHNHSDDIAITLGRNNSYQLKGARNNTKN